ncbi:stage II sporulation protein R [Bacillaceae bacterium W0354]
MRYVIAVLVVIVGIQFFYSEVVAQKGQSDETAYQVIPDEAIRLRILANSNSEKDQVLKRQVRDVVNEHITLWVEELTSIDEARRVLNEKLPVIESLVRETINDDDFSVTFGDVEFPDKIYDNYVYPAGTYEAILITIGEGKGDNWWCVLFPPLCFVDFANGATVLDHDEESDSQVVENDDEEDVEVKFFLWEWIKKLFNIA